MLEESIWLLYLWSPKNTWDVLWVWFSSLECYLELYIYSYNNWFRGLFRLVFSWISTLECSFHRSLVHIPKHQPEIQAMCWTIDGTYQRGNPDHSGKEDNFPPFSSDTLPCFIPLPLPFLTYTFLLCPPPLHFSFLPSFPTFSPAVFKGLGLHLLGDIDSSAYDSWYGIPVKILK